MHATMRTHAAACVQMARMHVMWDPQQGGSRDFHHTENEEAELMGSPGSTRGNQCSCAAGAGMGRAASFSCHHQARIWAGGETFSPKQTREVDLTGGYSPWGALRNSEV